jgi:predicted metal-dependent HD superfamily phosphohydrolase
MRLRDFVYFPPTFRMHREYNSVYKELKPRWNSLMQELGVEMGYDALCLAPTKGETLFLELCRKYSEKGRFYHTPRHVLECLKEFEEVKNHTKLPLEVSLALWFHDVIYNPKAKDNEEQSQQYAKRVVTSLKLNSQFAENLGNLILATKHITKPLTIDEALMMDIDLSILGKPRGIFDEYEKNIRKEYSFVNEIEFRNGRKRILEGFLARGEIYYSDYFRKKYEEMARENLEYSIKKLSLGD